jgi:hypothetical protein
MARRPPHRRSRSTGFAVLGALGLTAAIGPAVGAATASVDARVAATSATPTAPGAAAWVVRIELGGTTILEIGRTSVDTSTRAATATALAVNGQGPPAAMAGPTTPEATASVVDWTDDTGSLTVTGGYADAASAGQRWSAHAGLGQSTGTGIAMASRLLTWDQQTQLLDAVQSFNDTVTPLVGQAVGAVAPLLQVLGLPVPQFSPIAPAGLIDVGGGRLAGSAAEAATAPGFATARADAAAGGLELFGRFVTVDAVSSEATVERGAADQSAARSWLSGVQIAGVPVTVDGAGIRVAGGGPLEALLTPVLDGLLGQLAAAGITVRTAATPVGTACCSASAVALEVVADVPGGPLLVSIGGAEATAPEPLPRPAIAPAPSPTVPATTNEPPVVGHETTAAPRPALAPAPAPARPATPQPAAARSRIGMIADLGDDVAHALRIAYLLLVGGGAAATAFFTIAGPARPARPKRGTS